MDSTNTELKASSADLSMVTQFLDKLKGVPGIDTLVKECFAIHTSFLADGFSDNPETPLGKNYSQLKAILMNRELLCQSSLSTLEIAVLIQALSTLKTTVKGS